MLWPLKMRLWEGRGQFMASLMGWGLELWTLLSLRATIQQSVWQPACFSHLVPHSTSSPASLAFHWKLTGLGITIMAKFLSCFPAQLIHFYQVWLVNFKLVSHLLLYQTPAVANMQKWYQAASSHSFLLLKEMFLHPSKCSQSIHILHWMGCWLPPGSFLLFFMNVLTF